MAMQETSNEAETKNAGRINLDDQKIYTLCGVQGCCPTVTVQKDGFVITDDNGGEVKLTLAEFKELQAIPVE